PSVYKGGPSPSPPASGSPGVFLAVRPPPGRKAKIPRRRLRAYGIKEGGPAMYAVIKTGGKQYRVAKGDKLRVEKLPGNVGDTVTFDQVLLVGGEALKLGKPLVGGAKVEAKITAQGLGKKLIVFKFRR